MDTMDFPALPGDKALGRTDNKDPAGKVTASHKRRQEGVTTSKIFAASPAAVSSDNALESKHPITSRHQLKPTATNGSEALRKAMTDKIEKIRTTSRFKKK
jgi:hypothetical protein